MFLATDDYYAFETFKQYLPQLNFLKLMIFKIVMVKIYIIIIKIKIYKLFKF